jgi:hypothetical protein
VSRWRSSYPFDWDFRCCPPEELPILYNYEYSRESVWIREQVDFIRHGPVPSATTYYSPNPSFGWPEWPVQSYLSIPENERLRRLYSLLRDHEQFVELLHPPKIYASPTRTGRASYAARYADQLRALSVARLRISHTAAETLALLGQLHDPPTYTDTTALERAQRKAHRLLVRFVLLAKAQLTHGHWFPPFGAYIIRP